MAVALVIAPGCDDDDDPAAPPVATELAIVSGNPQTVEVSQAAAEPLVVVVNDQFDDPMPGVTVTWAVATGGGTLSATTITTNAEGQAQVTYTAGATAEAVTVTATVTGINPVTFSITVEAPAP
jgi:hypothetical protein